MERVFQCPQCEKGFKEVRTLRLHLKIHNAEYPEQCGVCQKVFRTKWQLKQHQVWDTLNVLHIHTPRIKLACFEYVTKTT